MAYWSPRLTTHRRMGPTLHREAHFERIRARSFVLEFPLHILVAEYRTEGRLAVLMS